MPKVSIIIPTLNRSRLLRSALKSALEQDYEDLEVVVSDDLSDDETADVVQSFRSTKVKYVRPPRRLNMPESFEFALMQASGEYLTFLTDDSFLMPDCISVALACLDREKVPLVVWKHCGYFDNDWIEPSRRNVLYIAPFSGGTEVLDSRRSLEKWLANMRKYSAEMPRSINSLCSRSIIQKALDRQGTFFLPPAPDHSSGAAMLLNTDRYALVDVPLVVDGVSRVSVGPSQSFELGKSAEEFYRSFGKDMSEVTLLGIPTTPAIIARSFENVRTFYPGCPPLDTRNVTSELADSLAKLEAYGSDMRGYWKVLLGYADSHPGETGRLFVMRRRIASALKWRGVKLIRSSPALSWLERFRGLDIVEGARAGFHDIEQAASRVAERNSIARQRFL